MKIFLHNITNITNVYSYINSLKIKKKKKRLNTTILTKRLKSFIKSKIPHESNLFKYVYNTDKILYEHYNVKINIFELKICTSLKIIQHMRK